MFFFSFFLVRNGGKSASKLPKIEAKTKKWRKIIGTCTAFDQTGIKYAALTHRFAYHCYWSNASGRASEGHRPMTNQQFRTKYAITHTHTQMWRRISSLSDAPSDRTNVPNEQWPPHLAPSTHAPRAHWSARPPHHPLHRTAFAICPGHWCEILFDVFFFLFLSTQQALARPPSKSFFFLSFSAARLQQNGIKTKITQTQRENKN